MQVWVSRQSPSVQQKPFSEGVLHTPATQLPPTHCVSFSQHFVPTVSPQVPGDSPLQTWPQRQTKAPVQISFSPQSRLPQHVPSSTRAVRHAPPKHTSPDSHSSSVAQHPKGPSQTPGSSAVHVASHPQVRAPVHTSPPSQSEALQQLPASGSSTHRLSRQVLPKEQSRSETQHSRPAVRQLPMASASTHSLPQGHTTSPTHSLPALQSSSLQHLLPTSPLHTPLAHTSPPMQS